MGDGWSDPAWGGLDEAEEGSAVEEGTNGAPPEDAAGADEPGWAAGQGADEPGWAADQGVGGAPGSGHGSDGGGWRADALGSDPVGFGPDVVDAGVGASRVSPPWTVGGELGLEHRAVEAVLLCAVEPVAAGLLAELLELPAERVERLCDDLARDYRMQRRGFVLARVAGGYRFQTDPELAPFVERFAMEGVSSRLSSAALETLAIVAYKQPVSRAQVSMLRGVNVDGVVRLLVQRGLITEVGHAPGPGQPVLYGTTPTFLERLGLDRIDELPAVEDLFPGPDAVEVLEARLRPGGDGVDGAGDGAAGDGSALGAGGLHGPTDHGGTSGAGDG